jgi:anaerobic magnesium-protoporphyrin IX monomethyl ester cyclase
MSLETMLARTWVRSYDSVTDALSRRVCHGLYDGERLEPYRQASGEVPVVFAIPAMSDVNGALVHPGVHILQRILRHEGIRCEVLNYNLPTLNPREPFDHLIRTIRALGVRVLGISTYSQAIRNTLEGLRRVRQACPDVRIVLGGPHPTESYLSVMGVEFVDYVCRGEAEESFPALVHTLLAGRRPEPDEIPGVYFLDRRESRVRGRPAAFIDVEKFDLHQLLRYDFSTDELRQLRLYRGAHGMAGAEYWPVALVRGCPYDCTFCGAFQMSGKKLRYRRVDRVADDLQFYVENYRQRHFSFIDDAFTQHYEYVIELCDEILRRKLPVRWTTDNGIRYETLGGGKLLERCLKQRNLANADELIALMIRAGWRGTAIGIESGSMRVRTDLVRKGGLQLSNEEILDNLARLKRVARREGVYFYINGFLMAGFPELPLPNGKVVAAETKEEMESTRTFALQLRDRGAIDMMSLSMVIPLPGTDMWECLSIRQKMKVLLSAIPAGDPESKAILEIEARILAAYPDLEKTRYREEPEQCFWAEAYCLSDRAQILIMQSYDAFNADLAQNIELKRAEPAWLWNFRERAVGQFYDGIKMKLQMLKHVVHRSSTPHDVAAYLTLMGRKFDTSSKTRPVASV